jgi:N-acetylneuraminic acid mutarotase
LIYLRYLANPIMPFKKLLLLFIALATLASCKKEKPFVPNYANALPGLWKQLGDFEGVGRVRAFAFSIGKKGYIIGGNAGSGFNIVPLYDFWEYDPATDKWTRKADYPGQAAEYIRGFSINNKGYVGTGFGQRVYIPDGPAQNKDFWEYDPATDKWTQKADFAGIERENVIAFEINGVGYLGLGTNNNYDASYKDFWKYDVAADKWTRMADYPGNGSFGVAAFSIGGKGYAGLGGSAPDIVKNDFWEYDPATNKWTAKADFTGPERVFSSQFTIGTDAYVGLGTTAGGSADDWYKYDTLTNIWIKATTFGGIARYDAVSFAIDGIGYIGTGNPGLQYDFWKYTPTKKQ